MRGNKHNSMSVLMLFTLQFSNRRRKNQCRETRNQISQNSPRRLIILRGEYNRDPLRDRANEMANNHRTLRDAEGNTNGSVGDINGTSTSEIPEQDINNLHARLSVMHGLVLLASKNIMYRPVKI